MPRVICAIGCGTFQDEKLDPLPGALDDARRMFSLLTNSSLGAADPNEPPSKLVLNPTQDEILSELASFFEGARLMGADAIVYFSGHALPLSSGGWGFFCSDSSADSPAISTLSFRDLEARWHDSGTLQCIFIIDTCYARTAVPAEFISKSSSVLSAPSPRATEEGLVLIWSSTETSKSYENGENSLFLRLFEKGINIGFDSPPFKRFVRASEAVQWMQSEAEIEGNDDFLKVSCSELGVTDSLYLSKNPRYDENATAGMDPQVLLQLETRQTAIQRMRMLSSIAAAHRERRPRLEARRSTVTTSLSPYLRFDPVTNTEICLVPTTRRGVVVAELWLWVKLFAVTVPLLIWVGEYRGRLGLLCVYGVMLMVSAIRIFIRRHEWQAPLRHFLLVTQDGFFQQHGANGKALLWSCVANIHHNFLETEIRILKEHGPEETLNIDNDKVAFSLTSAYGRFTLESLLQWGKYYAKNRWQWETFAAGRKTREQKRSESPVHLLVALSSYEHFQALPGCEDLKVAKAAFADDSVISLSDPSLPEFRKQLDGAFKGAAGGTLILYFSGHALVKGRELYLMTRESNPEHVYSGFPLHKLSDLQQERSVSDLVVILDCCFSGAGAPSLGISLGDVRSWLERMRLGVQGRIWLLAGSREDQKALAKSASLFTTALFNAAKELCQTDGTLQISEWYEATAKRMRFGQQPVFFSFEEPTRRVRLGATSQDLIKKARELQGAARTHAEQQESRLSAIAKSIEPMLSNSEYKMYEISGQSGFAYTGAVFRSKHKWKAGGRVRSVIGQLASGSFLVSAAVLFIFLVGIAITMSVLGRVPDFLGWVAGIGGVLAALGFLGFLIALPVLDKDLYVAIADDGIICKSRESISIIPADNIVDTYYAGQVITVDYHTVMSDGIGVRLRSGREIKVFEEFDGPSNKMEWPAGIKELKAIVELRVAEFESRRKQFDGDLAHGTAPPPHVKLEETRTS
jgi:hypothetical protein